MTTAIGGPPVALSRADRLQPLLLVGSIGLGLLIAGSLPGIAASLDWLVAAGVFGLIYLVMLGLDIASSRTVLARRRFVVIAVGVNFVVNPLVAWALGALFLAGEPDLRVGLMLFLFTPCIGWFLIFTELAGGHVGLGISLLGINTTLQVLLLPIYLWVFTGEAAAVDLGDIARSIVVFLLAPAAAAVASRRAVGRGGRDVTAALERFPVGHVKTAVLGVVIVAMFAAQGQELLDNPAVVVEVLPPMLVFFGFAFVLAVAIGRVARLPYDETALLAFTASSRNSEASLAIAATAFASPLVGLTVVIGPVVELPLLVMMVRVLNTTVRSRFDGDRRA